MALSITKLLSYALTGMQCTLPLGWLPASFGVEDSDASDGFLFVQPGLFVVPVTGMERYGS
jgi:hypothetical protein